MKKNRYTLITAALLLSVQFGYGQAHKVDVDYDSWPEHTTLLTEFPKSAYEDAFTGLTEKDYSIEVTFNGIVREKSKWITGNDVVEVTIGFSHKSIVDVREAFLSQEFNHSIPFKHAYTMQPGIGFGDICFVGRGDNRTDFVAFVVNNVYCIVRAKRHFELDEDTERQYKDAEERGDKELVYSIRRLVNEELLKPAVFDCLELGKSIYTAIESLGTGPEITEAPTITTHIDSNFAIAEVETEEDVIHMQSMNDTFQVKPLSPKTMRITTGGNLTKKHEAKIVAVLESKRIVEKTLQLQLEKYKETLPLPTLTLTPQEINALWKEAREKGLSDEERVKLFKERHRSKREE